MKGESKFTFGTVLLGILAILLLAAVPLTMVFVPPPVVAEAPMPFEVAKAPAEEAVQQPQAKAPVAEAAQQPQAGAPEAVAAQEPQATRTGRCRGRSWWPCRVHALEEGRRCRSRADRPGRRDP